MTTRTVTAIFNSRAEAGRAVEQLVSELGVDRATVRTSPEAGAADTGYDASQPYQETGFWASLKDLFLPEEDRYAYAEAMRRGNVLVSAQVDQNQVERASDILERAGAVDPDQLETGWRQSGWTGYDASAAGAARSSSAGMSGATATTGTLGTASTEATQAIASSANTSSAAATTARSGITQATGTAQTAAGNAESIPIVEERLIVGKREVERGRVRVRSYVVERPVEEQVRLHEERVEVERRPVDRPLTAADAANIFQERVIEATATSEEAVVSKEARVVEEIAVHKEAADRVETVRDTVRRTEVEVEGDATGTARGTATTTDTATGTGVGAAVDRTLGTNISGTNPGRKS